MTAACSLLLKADQSVEQIAAAVGISILAIFSPISPVPWDDPKAWKTSISALATIMLPLNQLVQAGCVYFPDFLNRPANWIAAQTMKKFW